MVVVAWLITALYYFYQYVLRSAPSVMMPQLSGAFGIGASGVASIVGLFYYGYSPFSLVAGVAMDRLGPRRVVPIGALTGGVFALVGAVYIATSNFPASRAATLIGATQMFGMAGGSAGQFLVGPMIASGMRWNFFWIGMGLAGLAIAAALAVLLPREKVDKSQGDWLKGSLTALRVFRNPQSILCGLIAGLLFIPTTIFDMVWGVRFLQEAHGFSYAEAVIRSATVPLGWIIGCPLLGMISDR